MSRNKKIISTNHYVIPEQVFSDVPERAIIAINHYVIPEQVFSDVPEQIIIATNHYLIRNKYSVMFRNEQSSQRIIILSNLLKQVFSDVPEQAIIATNHVPEQEIISNES
jgi:hypothetical protein